MRKLLLPLILIALSVFTSCTKEIPEHPNRYTGHEGKYLGLKDPGDTARVFGAGVVSTGLNERDAAFSPDYKEFYYTVMQNKKGTIVVMRQINGKWINPRVVPFSGMYSDLEPFITHDGTKLYFASNRPVDGTEVKDYDIWYVERIDDGWGEPKRLSDNVNSGGNEYYPSLTKKGDLYFTSDNDKAIGSEDIFVSKFDSGEFMPYENLGDSVNSDKYEFNSFIAPDGSYLVYTTTGFGAGEGGGDLWVSFKKNDSTWSSPKNLGKQVNTDRLEYCPSISPDGKYLFFSSNRASEIVYDKKQTYQQMLNSHNSPMNGTGDIYWISSSVIEKLK